MQTVDIVKALPKVEQHVHILGSITPATLLKVIEETGIDAPYSSVEDIEQLFEFQNFMHFLSVYTQVIELVNEEKYFENMAYELLQKSSECNVKYVEISFSAPDHVQKGLDFDLMMDAILRGIRKGHREFGVKADIRIDLVRSFGLENAMKTLDMISSKPDGIVSIDMGGPEKEFPPKPYASAYKRAKEMGLHLVAHAGESAGPESIWDAVKNLDVERIGHGVSAIDDTTLMKHLLEKGITIEACPVSNVRTNVVGSLSEHPIREFFNRGLSVSVNSDDPSFFWTDMNNEYVQLHEHLGFTPAELFSISLNSIESSFIDNDNKMKMRRSFEDEFNRIVGE
jgi:adenosine deaminase